MAKEKQRLNPQPTDAISVTHGSGNVFADLGFEDAPELQVKAGLTHQICNRLKALGLTQVQAAAQLGISQPDVSKLMNGRYTGFSADRLIALLNALQVDIDIVIRPHRRNGKYRKGIVCIVGTMAA
jgi:predicted XRE-type DNA-binding protein